MEPPSLEVSAPEAERRDYLNHEASVRSIGVLYLVFSVLTAIFAILSLCGVIENKAGGVVLDIVMLAFAALEAWVGFGLRRLDRKAKPVAIVFAVIGLVGFPVGTAISAYILYLLVSKKGKHVLSPEYQALVQATPGIKYKMSPLMMILGLLVIALLVLGVIVTVTGKP